MGEQLRLGDLVPCEIRKDLRFGVGFGDYLRVRENLFSLIVHH